jgi:hypothetical protein
MTHITQGRSAALARPLRVPPRCYARPTVRELPRRWDPLAEREMVVPSWADAYRIRRRGSGS